MDNWKVPLLFVTFCTVIQIYQGQSSAAEEERGLSRDWKERSLDTGETKPAPGLVKKAKELRFYGLMGKRSGMKTPRKVNGRHKGQMFVGLMGRSLSSGEFLSTCSSCSTETEAGYDCTGLSEEPVQILY